MRTELDISYSRIGNEKDMFSKWELNFSSNNYVLQIQVLYFEICGNYYFVYTLYTNENNQFTYLIGTSVEPFQINWVTQSTGKNKVNVIGTIISCVHALSVSLICRLFNKVVHLDLRRSNLTLILLLAFDFFRKKMI